MQHALLRGAALAAALLCVSVGSQAALFEDDEARRAILDLRQRVEAMRQQTDQRPTKTASCAAACSTCRTRSSRCGAISRA
jgi:hypothetical protein